MEGSSRSQLRPSGQVWATRHEKKTTTKIVINNMWNFFVVFGIFFQKPHSTVFYAVIPAVICVGTNRSCEQCAICVTNQCKNSAKSFLHDCIFEKFDYIPPLGLRSLCNRNRIFLSLAVIARDGWCLLSLYKSILGKLFFS